MTYYIGNGETTNGKPENRRIMINWASTWADGYCNNVDKVTDSGDTMDSLIFRQN